MNPPQTGSMEWPADDSGPPDDRRLRRSWAGRTSPSSRAAATAPTRPSSGASPRLDRPERADARDPQALRPRPPLPPRRRRRARRASRRSRGPAPSPTSSTPWPSCRGSRATGSTAGARPAAIDRYVDAVAYAYDFLFDPELAAGRQPSDPRFRLACDLYNGGLDRLIRAAQSNGQIKPDGDDHAEGPRPRAGLPRRACGTRPGRPTTSTRSSSPPTSRSPASTPGATSTASASR